MTARPAKLVHRAAEPHQILVLVLAPGAEHGGFEQS